MPRTGNLTGETFDPQVIAQINARQKFLGARIRNDQHILYSNNNSSFLRLASSININDSPEGKDQLKKRKINENLTGNKLAKSCVLFGGTVGLDDSYNPKLKYGIVDNYEENFDFISTTAAYGWGGISSRGFVPMPAIESADISFINRGALAKANVKIKVYSVEQLQIFDVLYFRIGYSMLLEWGHNYILSNDLENNTNPITPRICFDDPPIRNFFEGETQEKILKAIKDQRKNDNYNYDAMLGKVTNFTWKFNPDGSYDIDLNLIGYGDIIESLKINTSAVFDPKQSNQSSADKTNDAQNKAVKAAENAGKNLETVQKTYTGAAFSTNKTTLTTNLGAVQIYDGNGRGYLLQAINFLGISTLIELPAVEYPSNKQSAKESLAALNQVQTELSNAAASFGTYNGNQDFSIPNRSTIAEAFTTYTNITTSFAALKAALTALSAAFGNKDATDNASKAAQIKAQQEKKKEELAPQYSVAKNNVSKLNDQLYKWREQAINSPPNSSSDFYKIKLTYSDSKDINLKNLELIYAYVRLGHLLEWIQNNLLYYDDTKNNNPIFTIYYKEENNYCLRFPTQVSSDPKICIIPSRIICEETILTDLLGIEFKDGNIEWNALSDLQKKAPYFVENEPNKGNLMNIFVNIDYTAKCVADNTDSDGKTNLFKFLTSLLNSINDALGNVNKLEPVFDTEVNQLKIIEGSGLNNEPDKEIAIFQTFGIGTEDMPKGSFITNVDFQVQLPPNMAAMATISAQAKGNIVGENATGLSRLNTGFTDRVITTKFTKDMIENGNDNSKLFIGKLQQMAKQINELYGNGIYPTLSIDALRSINRDVSLYITGEEATQKKAPAPFFIPFNLSLTMNGLSGMVNYERFAITEDILPYSYRSAGDQGGVIDFLIKGVSHSIKDNKWTTKIESLSVSSIRKKK